MKHLKKFQIFESDLKISSDETKSLISIKEEIGDILLPISDMNFKVEVKHRRLNYGRIYDEYIIDLVHSTGFFRPTSDFVDCLTHLLNYSADIGFDCDIEVIHPFRNSKKFTKENIDTISDFEMQYIRIKLHKFLIKESFSMQRDNCDRCGKSTNGLTIMSIFNEDVICASCKEEEKQDPEYEAASLAEIEAVRAGDRNFKGAIPDYKPLKR